MSVTLGISNTHNGSVAIIRDGVVLAAIQAERISRIKRQSLPLEGGSSVARDCVKYCLNEAKISYSSIKAIALCTPWEVTKIDENRLFNFIGGEPKNYSGTFYIPHHLSHAEYIVHYGRKKPGLVLVVDGSGSLEIDRRHFNVEERVHCGAQKHVHFAGKEVVSAYMFDGNHNHLIYRFSPSISEIDDYNRGTSGLLQSIGHYWEWASLYCCGTRNDAGKVMGLAAFGNTKNVRVGKFLYLENEWNIRVDYLKLQQEFQQPNIKREDLSNLQHYADIALQVQLDTEKVILELVRKLNLSFPSDTFYMTGGVGLNVVVNEKIIRSRLFKDVVLNGSVEDNGSAIGAGLLVSNCLTNTRKFSPITDYYGQTYSDEDCVIAAKQFKYSYQVLAWKEIIELASDLIASEKIIGWFQGRSEFGPRALGNRSILANPAAKSTKYLLDNLMKCRDRYRPYAPVVIEEEADHFFDIEEPSPVMMRNVPVKDESLIAIMHADNCARVQTIKKEENARLHELLLGVKKKTGYPVLLNTSFNLPGEPIVESPNDALISFSNGALDALFLHNVFIDRNI
ncbi:MAG: carbamoyltransferase C-terminal domain-containing protein [Pseudomonadota bacterium]|nr:carbamoyltransferase C-terminal domain-containing protein [Pseudomonadota bacterium]